MWFVTLITLIVACPCFVDPIHSGTHYSASSCFQLQCAAVWERRGDAEREESLEEKFERTVRMERELNAIWSLTDEEDHCESPLSCDELNKEETKQGRVRRGKRRKGISKRRQEKNSEKWERNSDIWDDWN